MQEERTCECGCGSMIPARNRFAVGHNRRIVMPYRVDPITACWEWTASRDRHGYGALRVGKRIHRAHRVYYERHVGPIPAGFDIDHLCRNRACVNPEHLEPVTEAQNTQRGNTAKLTWDDVRAIRASGLGCSEVGRRWGIHSSSASEVLRGKTWKEAA